MVHVLCGRACHKEYTYEISVFNRLKDMAKVHAAKADVNTDADTVADTRAMTLAPKTFVLAC